MKKHFTKAARRHSHHRAGLGIHGLELDSHDSSDYSPYYAYPPVVTSVHKVPSAKSHLDAPILWTPRLMQDKYSQLMPPIVIKIAADYISHYQ